MSELLTLAARTTALPASTAGAAAGSGAADAGAFEHMLQAGLADRRGAAAGMARPADPAAAKPAATPKSPAGTAASAAASEDRGKSQPADEGASEALAAQLAYGAGAVAAASPASAGSEMRPCAPAAAPVLTDQRPEAGSAVLAAAMAQPALGQPALGQPALGQPALGQPALGQPALGQPTLVQPTPGQPALGQPTLVQPTLVQPTPGQAAVTPPATETVSNRDGKVDPSAAAASDGRTPRAAIAGSAVAPRELAEMPGNQASDRIHLLSKSAEAGTRAAQDATDVTAQRRPIRQAGSTGRDDLGNAIESPDAERQRNGLQDPIRSAERPTDLVTDRFTERLNERAAERPADPAARIDTMLRADLAPRLDTAPPTPDRAGSVPVLHVDHSLGSPEWKREFGSQLSLLVSRREPHAEIRLNPPQLGPVEVRIGLQGDQVSLAFIAPQPDTRAAIENALPQLREMLAGNGLALGNASVSAESSRQQSSGDTRPQPQPFLPEEPIVADSAPEPRRAALRLVDTFA